MEEEGVFVGSGAKTDRWMGRENEKKGEDKPGLKGSGKPVL